MSAQLTALHLTSSGLQIQHCADRPPMHWTGTGTRYTGPPGEGDGITENRFECACGATIAIALAEPS